MNGLNTRGLFLADWPLTELFLILHVDFYEWMHKLIHQDIGKSPKYGQQLYHMPFKLDCKESVTESTQGKIYTI